MSDYMKARRGKRRAKYIELLGGKCSNCGSTNQLEFDHKDSKKKEFDLNDIRDGSEETILKELKKCVLLCKPCHMEKGYLSKDFVNKDKEPARHGTVWMYKRYKCRCDKCKSAMHDYYISR